MSTKRDRLLNKRAEQVCVARKPLFKLEYVNVKNEILKYSYRNVVLIAKTSVKMDRQTDMKCVNC